MGCINSRQNSKLHTVVTGRLNISDAANDINKVHLLKIKEKRLFIIREASIDKEASLQIDKNIKYT